VGKVQQLAQAVGAAQGTALVVLEAQVMQAAVVGLPLLRVEELSM